MNSPFASDQVPVAEADDPPMVGLEPDHEFGGDVLGIEQVFASVGLSVDPSPNESPRSPNL